MRVRNFLLIHASRSIRTMIANRILANLGDVEIVESGTGQEALLNLGKQSFDLTICSSDLADMSSVDLRQALRDNSNQNKATEFIILCESENDLESLTAAGFEHIVPLPFDPADFIAKINKICDPRKWRQNERFHIPHSKIVISVWGMETEARMINLSRGGLLLELSGDRSDLLLQNDPKLTLKIKTPHGHYEIAKLPAKLARLNVIEWNSNYKPSLMRVAYIFLDLDQSSQVELEQLIQMAEEDQMYADEE